MKIDIEKNKTHATIILSRAITFKVSNMLLNTFIDLKSNGILSIDINMARVSYINNDGLLTLVKATKIFDGEQNIKLLHIQSQPLLLLEMTGFEKLFIIE